MMRSSRNTTMMKPRSSHNELRFIACNASTGRGRRSRICVDREAEQRVAP
jgi:hypothetical protein